MATTCRSVRSLLTCGYLGQARIRFHRWLRHGGRGRGRGSGPSEQCLDLELFRQFHDLPQMPKATGRNSKNNAPTTPGNRSAAARDLTGYEQCWCRGFNVGCGLVRTLRTRQRHAMKEIRMKEGNYDKYNAIFLSDRSPYNSQRI